MAASRSAFTLAEAPWFDTAPASGYSAHVGFRLLSGARSPASLDGRLNEHSYKLCDPLGPVMRYLSVKGVDIAERTYVWSCWLECPPMRAAMGMGASALLDAWIDRDDIGTHFLRIRRTFRRGISSYNASDDVRWSLSTRSSSQIQLLSQILPGSVWIVNAARSPNTLTLVPEGDWDHNPGFYNAYHEIFLLIAFGKPYHLRVK